MIASGVVTVHVPRCRLPRRSRRLEHNQCRSPYYFLPLLRRHPLPAQGDSRGSRHSGHTMSVSQVSRPCLIPGANWRCSDEVQGRGTRGPASQRGRKKEEWSGRSLDGLSTLAGHGLATGQTINWLTELTLGTHTFRVTSVDHLGNSGTSSVGRLFSMWNCLRANGRSLATGLI